MKKVIAGACALALLAVIVPRAVDLISLAAFIADYLFRVYARFSGWSRWYLLTASVSGSWAFARLGLRAVRELKRVADGPSLLSAGIEIAIMAPVYFVGGVIAAAGAGAAWPLTLTYAALSRRQRVAERERADRLEAESLRNALTSAGAPEPGMRPPP
jgi:hypothetical protein